jgi:HEAT repeat protein/predicted RNA-binding Zn-ribbon protein involved in translation (DUF1610 family)
MEPRKQAEIGKLQRIIKKRMDAMATIDDLIRALKHEDPGVREKAIVALGELGDDRAVEPLVRASLHVNYDTSERAVDALRKIGDARVVGLLSQALKEYQNDHVRQKAAEVLGELGDARAVEPLILALFDTDSWVEMNAAETLGKIGDVRAVRHLVDKLKSSPDDLVREAAAKGLAKIRDGSVVVPLVQAFKDEYDKKITEIIVGSLIERGDLRGAETIISYLFAHPLLGVPCWEDTGINALKNLLGDYYVPIIKASQVKKTTRTTVKDWEHSVDEFDYDLRESNEGLSELIKIHTQISSNILHKISERGDLEVETSYTEYLYGPTPQFYTSGILSFESQRKRARSELDRRGNPSYDPSAYLKKEAWKPSVLWRFSEDDQYVGAECPNCGKVLKIRKATLNTITGGFVSSNRILCKCGQTYDTILDGRP